MEKRGRSPVSRKTIRAALESNLPNGMQLSNGAFAIAFQALKVGVKPSTVGRAVHAAGRRFAEEGRTRGKVGPFGPGREPFTDIVDLTLLTRAQRRP